jgi:hypothetical protein
MDRQPRHRTHLLRLQSATLHNASHRCPTACTCRSHNQAVAAVPVSPVDLDIRHNSATRCSPQSLPSEFRTFPLGLTAPKADGCAHTRVRLMDCMHAIQAANSGVEARRPCCTLVPTRAVTDAKFSISLKRKQVGPCQRVAFASRSQACYVNAKTLKSEACP